MTRLSRREFAIGAGAVGLASALGPTVRAATPAGKPDVIVLGAGISGLETAWQLEQQGLRVQVLEGRRRVGGRVHTWYDLPGYPEMGFNSMGDGYGRGLDLARRTKVPLLEVGSRFRQGKPQELYLDGQRITREQWRTHPLNPFPEAQRASMPWELVPMVVARGNRLADYTTWQDPANRALDISVNQYLVERGFSQDAIRLANDVSPGYGINSQDLSTLMLEFTDGFVKQQMAAGPKSWAAQGGNQKLPEALAAMLKSEVLLGKEVVAVDNRADGVEVRCADGSVHRAAHVVCSLPFSALRNVRITPALTGAQARAVATLPYQPLSMVFLTASKPFWDADGNAPGMWTNGIAGTLLPQRFGQDPAEITGFVAQARGQLALNWDRLGHAEVMRRVVAEIEALRPAAKGKLRAHRLHSWSAEYFNGGDWAYFAPGQLTDFAAVMGAPAGRIHFCGEHTARGSRGFEGALESAERVVTEILSL